ncbi:gluzincin family metallopeptidase [Streptomyces wuyuanensis]|uniref:Peptidase MA superfamily protein n=1 Tax=Streptomyces wuyuanensis TaxID=1196353 RepID=A0A1G9QXJ3_9ACTN|nr:hypothetical protein [Streptomyces wuyuanensis]SDM15704.1 hypothetical protein SAMN05444921_104348 [Streptomyces wuyuanensis]
MAGQGRFGRTAGRRRGAALVLTALVLAGSLLTGGCADGPRRDTTAQEVQRTLDARAAAVLRHDEAGYLAALDPSARQLAAVGRAEFANLAEVPLGSWEYRVTHARSSGGRATADAELRYRLDGYDTSPVTAERRLELAERDGRWYITADRPGHGGGQQLWQQGDVEVVRGTRSLVLGVGQPSARLEQMAAEADRAVPAVSAAWAGAWAGRVVVMVPASLEAMGRLLGAPAAEYRGIAAVTTGRAGPPGKGDGPLPADRVTVNPEAYGLLGDLGRRVVLTHETAHVATRAHTSASTPLWLSEGFADWAAYRGTGGDLRQAAPELRRAVLGGDVPAALPTDADFRFGGDARVLGRAYEGGRLACELIADRWGEDRLRAFYRAVGASEARDGAVESALDEVLGTSPERFTADWREYMGERLG